MENRTVASGRGCRRLAAAIALAVVCAGPLSAQALESTDELRLRPGDLVRIQIKDEPGLSGEFAVAEDGRMLLPLIGMVAVADRRFGDVRAELWDAYAREVRDPVIIVTPLVRIAVLGEVRRPGVFPVDPTLSLADVLANVGGITPLGDDRRVSLVRNGEIVAARIQPGAPVLSTALRSGDQIVVGRQGWVRENMPVLVGAAASVAAAALTALIIR